MEKNQCNSQSIVINGITFWFETFGTGLRPLLLIPGGIGTGRTDFLPQLEDEEDALDQKEFTIVAVEGQGWGHSCTPARRYGSAVYDIDAQAFYKIMQHLGYKRFSVIAWSDGAKTALTLVTKYPGVVQSMVLMGVDVIGSQRALKWLKSITDIKSWGLPKIECYLRVYDSREKIQELWQKYTKFCEYLTLYFGDDMFKDKYHLIKCPVLIILGEKDQISDVDQCLHLNEQIKNSKLIRFPTAGHDFHQRYPSIFKKLIEDHLITC